MSARHAGDRHGSVVAAIRIVKGRHFDQEIIILCVRWYVTYKLSYRDLAAMMLERAIWGGADTSLQVGPTVLPEVESAGIDSLAQSAVPGA